MFSRTRNQISRADLDRFARVFRKCARNDMELTREQFQKMVSSQNKYFVDRAFTIFDRSGSGKVSLDEYVDTLNQLMGTDNEGAIQFLFHIYDENGDQTERRKKHVFLISDLVRSFKCWIQHRFCRSLKAGHLPQKKNCLVQECVERVIFMAVYCMYIVN